MDKKITLSAKNAKLKLLFVISNRSKAEFYVDMLRGYEVNMELVIPARGTASTEMLSLLGLDDSDKALIVGAVRTDIATSLMNELDKKFKTVKNGKGIAFTVPLTSTIGVAAYRFLSNRSEGGEKWNSNTK